ncbi:MAG: hypothetical protein WC476_00780 [Phycisphaerae bacterium]|jgi:hypothetical protein
MNFDLLDWFEKANAGLTPNIHPCPHCLREGHIGTMTPIFSEPSLLNNILILECGCCGYTIPLVKVYKGFTKGQLRRR